MAASPPSFTHFTSTGHPQLAGWEKKMNMAPQNRFTSSFILSALKWWCLDIDSCSNFSQSLSTALGYLRKHWRCLWWKCIWLEGNLHVVQGPRWWNKGSFLSLPSPVSIRYRLGRQVYFNVRALGLLLTTCFIRDGFSSLFFHYLCCLEVGRKGFQLYYLKKKSLENICKSTKRCWWYNTSERNPAYKIIYPGWHIMMMWCQIHEGDNTTKCYIIFSGLENDLTCFNWYFLVFPKFCFEYLVNKH